MEINLKPLKENHGTILDSVNLQPNQNVLKESLFKNKKIYVEIFNNNSNVSDILDEILISNGAQVNINK